MRLLARWLIASAPLLALLAWVWSTHGDGLGAKEYFSHWRHAEPALTATLKIVTNWGNKVFYGVYAGLLLWGLLKKHPRFVRLAAVYTAFQVAVSFGLVNASKIIVGKPRPDVNSLFSPLSLEGAFHAWPSGHTAEFTASMLPLLFWARGWAAPPAVLAGSLAMALMGFTRLYLGWHHPSDVLMGWLVGSYTALGIYWFGIQERT